MANLSRTHSLMPHAQGSRSVQYIWKYSPFHGKTLKHILQSISSIHTTFQHKTDHCSHLFITFLEKLCLYIENTTGSYNVPFMLLHFRRLRPKHHISFFGCIFLVCPNHLNKSLFLKLCFMLKSSLNILSMFFSNPFCGITCAVRVLQIGLSHSFEPTQCIAIKVSREWDLQPHFHKRLLSNEKNQ